MGDSNIVIAILFVVLFGFPMISTLYYIIYRKVQRYLKYNNKTNDNVKVINKIGHIIVQGDAIDIIVSQNKDVSYLIVENDRGIVRVNGNFRSITLNGKKYEGMGQL